MNISRFRDVFAGGWVAAAPFVLLGAPERWQWLAMAMGAIVAWVYSASPGSIAGAGR